MTSHFDFDGISIGTLLSLSPSQRYPTFALMKELERFRYGILAFVGIRRNHWPVMENETATS
jgi:hypothetical protein